MAEWNIKKWTEEWLLERMDIWEKGRKWLIISAKKSLFRDRRQKKKKKK